MGDRESEYREIPLRRLGVLLGVWIAALVALAVAGVLFQPLKEGSELAIFASSAFAITFLFSWTRPKAAPRPHPAAAIRPAFGAFGRRGAG